jgi:hypothetical protein
LAETLVLIHHSLKSIVPPLLQAGGLSIETSFYDSDFESTFGNPAFAWQDSSRYLVVFLLAEAFHADLKLPADVRARLETGTARLVIFGAPVFDEQCGFEVPATYIPDGASAGAKEFIFNHICRQPGWGLATVLPKGGQIFTAQLSDEKQINQKTNHAIEFLESHGPSWQGRTLAIRMAVLNALSVAAKSSFGKPGKRLPTLQLGLSESAVLVSIRWRSDDEEIRFIQTQVRTVENLNWRLAFRECAMSAVQINHEGLEIEVILGFDCGPRESEVVDLPLIVNTLSRARMNLNTSLVSHVQDFKFEYFQARTSEPASRFDKMEEPAAAVSLPATKEVSDLELRGLRVEKVKLEKALTAAQEQANELTRKLAQALDGQQELSMYKTRLENAKAKEMDLIKKLSQAIEMVKALKSSQSKAG